MKTVVFSGAMATMTLFRGTFIGYSNYIYNMAQKVRNLIFVSGNSATDNVLKWCNISHSHQ